jgi:PAS domain S-box-containing protein
MTDSLHLELQKAINRARESHNIDEGIKHLAMAFSLFSSETNRLGEAYSQLQNRFEQVSNQLEKSDKELRNKVIELNTLSNYLGNILKNISQGILFIDTQGIITTCNQAACKILKIEEKDTLLKNFWNLFPDNYFGFSLKNALFLGGSQSLHYITLSDKKKEIEVSSSFVHDKLTQYQGLIILLRDVTQIQKLQIIANRNDRMKDLGEMAATVAHEIRNPLGGIRGYASLLIRDLENFPHLKEMVTNIIEGTKSLEKLVNNVLHFSRPIQIHPQNHDLCILIKEIVKFIKVDPSLPKSIEIQTHFLQPSFFVHVDKEIFKSAILNLIMNAVQSIEEKGKIILSVSKHYENCIISISDTGKGIDEKDIDKIFSPFFTTKEKGNGLGLSEAYKIIQAHFGSIDVHSQTEGTTFTITLPLKRLIQ